MSDNSTNGQGPSKRLTVTVTNETRYKLDQILQSRPRSTSMNDILLEAISVYLNEQEDLIGSRQHFNRTFQRSMTQLENEVIRHMNLIVFLTASGLAQLAQLNGNLEQSSTLVNPGWYLKLGVEGMLRDGERLNEQLRAIRNVVDEVKQT